MTKSLSNYVFFGTSVSQLFDTADFMYTLPAHRITVYIMGILLGYALRMCKDLKLTKVIIRNFNTKTEFYIICNSTETIESWMVVEHSVNIF